MALFDHRATVDDRVAISLQLLGFGANAAVDGSDCSKP
jgi:hypothetical protein